MTYLLINNELSTFSNNAFILNSYDTAALIAQIFSDFRFSSFIYYRPINVIDLTRLKNIIVLVLLNKS